MWKTVEKKKVKSICKKNSRLKIKPGGQNPQFCTFLQISKVYKTEHIFLKEYR